MADLSDSTIHNQLLIRRSRLENALNSAPKDPQLLQLITEVDAALNRLSERTYGKCSTCNEKIEPERLIADPLVQYCIDCLTKDQQRALEQDLVLSSQIQDALLPKQNFQCAGWETAYFYEGAGLVSGDYCDIVSFGGDLYFSVGDIAGKGLSASMLMSHIHATLRTLISLQLPLDQIVERASRMFCESTLPTHFATLVLGRANDRGEIEICNAGHNPPLLMIESRIESIDATGLPLGLFCQERFMVCKFQLALDDSILLYTDGVTETQNESGLEYGIERLSEIFREHNSKSSQQLISTCIKDLKSFQGSIQTMDDLKIMTVRRINL